MKITIENLIERSRKEASPEGRFTRRLSVYLTWIILRTPLSANFVTLAFGIVGMLSVILFANGERHTNIIGSILLILHVLLDYVDGDVARVRDTQSVFGAVFESILHDLTYPGLFLAIGWGFYHQNDGNEYILIISMIAAIFWIISNNISVYYQLQIIKNEISNPHETLGISKDIDLSLDPRWGELQQWIKRVIFDRLYWVWLWIPLFAALQILNIFVLIQGLMLSSLCTVKLVKLYWQTKAKPK